MKYLPIIFITLVFSTYAFAADFTVNLTTDEHDLNTSDGICAIAGGGGICTNNSFEIINNSTVTNNTSNSGGGITKVGGNLVLTDTIIAGNNISPNGIGPEILLSGGSSVISLGGNLIGKSSGNAANTGIVIDYQPTDILDVNPMLDTLRNNGGTTPTHALLARSPAIDKGINTSAIDYINDNISLTTDQRGPGFPRISDGDGDGTATVDIGAYENPSALFAAPVSIGGRVTNAKGRGIFRALVMLTNQNGEVKTRFTNPFGYYNFTGVPTGESYILSISSKQVTFVPRTVFASSDIGDLNFIGN